MEQLSHISDMIMNMSPVMISGIAAVLEVVLRLVKSEKPLSILHMLGMGARKIGELLVKIADLSDKILPQRLS